MHPIRLWWRSNSSKLFNWAKDPSLIAVSSLKEKSLKDDKKTNLSSVAYKTAIIVCNGWIILTKLSDSVGRSDPSFEWRRCCYHLDFWNKEGIRWIRKNDTREERVFCPIQLTPNVVMLHDIDKQMEVISDPLVQGCGSKSKERKKPFISHWLLRRKSFPHSVRVKVALFTPKLETHPSIKKSC